MVIITLTSDWGSGNHYPGAVKGALLRQFPEAKIIDVTHDIPSFDIIQASFVLKNAFPNFPEGSIHLVGVNTEGGIESPHVAVKYQGQYFVGADNGIFSLMFNNQAIEAVELDIIQDSDFFTFSTRDVFVKAAAMIAGGKSLDELGHPYPELNERFAFNPVVYQNKIIGKVIFVDDYGNVFVNIDQELFKKAGKGRGFMINFRSPDDGIDTICTSYSDVVPGEKVALFGSTGYLEIAINQGKASALLGLEANDTITITFKKEE